MSPRAACRLEMLGFRRVYDYVAGKEDWAAAMLPVDGNGKLPPRAGDALSRDVRTCRPDDRIDALGTPGFCAVTTVERIVVGALRRDDFNEPGDATAESRMALGPTTARPSEWLEGLVNRMRDAGVPRVLVTTPEGALLGEVERDRAQQLLHRRHAEHEAKAGREDGG